MITKQSDSFRKFAIWVGKSNFLKSLFRPLYTRYINYLKCNRNSLFLKNGLDVLKAFDKCLTTNGYPYSLAFGTMLGAVREHGFITHDFDMDVAMWIEDYSPELRKSLEKNGFNLIHELLVDDGELGREETYEKDGVNIDIFYIYPAIDDYPYTCDFLGHKEAISFPDSMKKYGYIIARRIQLPWKKEFKKVPFVDTSFPVCSNADDILSFRYGQDYMIPNPDWHYNDYNKYTTIWHSKKAVARFG